MPDWKTAKLYLGKLTDSCIGFVQQMENNVVTSLNIAHLYSLLIHPVPFLQFSAWVIIIFFPFCAFFFFPLKGECSSILLLSLPIVLSVKYSSAQTVSRDMCSHCRIFIHVEHSHNVTSYTGLLLTCEITGFFRFLLKCGFVL